MEMEEYEIKQCTVVNYRITMINSDFNTNFKIDLLKLLNISFEYEQKVFRGCVYDFPDGELYHCGEL